MYKDPAKQKEAQADWYRRNKDITTNRTRERRRYLRRFVSRVKRRLCCSECGMSFQDRPECCDFHHTDPTKKDGDVGKLMRSSGIKRVKQEIKKCVPICSNCHRTLHAKEQRN